MPVYTFMSLDVEKVDAITTDGFSGSVRTYIKQTKPDVVVVLYIPPESNDNIKKYGFR